MINILKQIQNECNNSMNCRECALYDDDCTFEELFGLTCDESPQLWNIDYIKENLERISKVIEKHNKEAKQ